MRKIPFILGSLILIGILMIMISPKTFAPKSPYTIQQIRFSRENGKLDIEAAPYPPSESFVLGSDSLGRDILSYIIYGTRLTISLGILVSIVQFLIGIPMAMYAGFGNNLIKSIIKQLSIMFSAIPALLISIILLRLDYFGQLSKQYSIIAFIIVITIVGWPKIGLILMERVEAINNQPFIKGAIAIGKKRRQIALTNVLPHLAPEIVVLFFMEIARNLSMIMQLGVFGIFVGNLKVIKDSTGGINTYYDVSFEPEWASMLSTSRNYISVAPWAVIFPALAFFISVLGFNLFGEGLRQLLQDKNSTILINIKKTFSLEGLKRLKPNPIKIGLAIMLTVILIFSLNLNEYKVTPDIAIDLSNEEVIIGTTNRDETAMKIIEYMQELNIEPLEDEDYIYDYTINDTYFLETQKLSILNLSTSNTFKPVVDYQMIKYSEKEYQGLIYNAMMDDLYNIKDYSVFENRFVLLNTKFYNEKTINYIITDITEHVAINGVLLVASSDDIVENVVVEKSDYPIMMITKNLSDYLLENEEIEIEILSSGRAIQPLGKNVVGIFKGSDPYMSDEAILIGLNYNDLNNSDVLRFNLSLMRKMTQLDNNKRSLIFMFLDGTISEDYNGIRDVADDFPYSSQKIKAYIDLTKLTNLTFDSLKFSSKQAPLTRPFPWSVAHQLSIEIPRNSIDIVELDTLYSGKEYYFTENETDNMMFWDKGIASIIISSHDDVNGSKDLYDLGEILVEVISLSNY